MRIGIVGNGRMGAALIEAARSEGVEIAAVFDRKRPLSAHDGSAALDAVIDFSAPDAVENNVRLSVGWSVPIVVGTTGIADSLDSIRSFVEVNDGTLLYSPNFSIGAAVLRRALMAAISLGRHLEGVDISIHEVHHKSKRDRPSGTALLLADDVRRLLTNGSVTSADLPDVSASRVGDVFGEHTVRLEASDDEITLHHRAGSRRGFAIGALRAAQWLVGRSGYFTMDDFLSDLITDEMQASQNLAETAL